MRKVVESIIKCVHVRPTHALPRLSPLPPPPPRPPPLSPAPRLQWCFVDALLRRVRWYVWQPLWIPLSFKFRPLKRHHCNWGAGGASWCGEGAPATNIRMHKRSLSKHSDFSHSFLAMIVWKMKKNSNKVTPTTSPPKSKLRTWNEKWSIFLTICCCRGVNWMYTR